MPSTHPTFHLLRHALALALACTLAACGGSGSGSDSGTATVGSQKSAIDAADATAASKPATDSTDIHFAP